MELDPIDVPLGEDAPAAIDQLADGGIGIVLGSYGTTILRARPPTRPRGEGWCSGRRARSARCLPRRRQHRLFPRRSERRQPWTRRGRLHRPPSRADARPIGLGLRFGVVSVDDAYGSTVADGAIDEIHALHLPFAGRFNYDANRLDAHALIHRVAKSHPRCALRRRVPRRRRRDQASDGRRTTPLDREHRHLVELLHAGVRQPTRTPRRSGSSPRTSSTVSTSTSPA